MTDIEDLGPRQKRILNDVFRELENAVSVADARLTLEAKSDGARLPAVPHLEPVVFAVRYATWRNYVYGVVVEISAWFLFLIFSLTLLLAGVGLIAVTAFSVFSGQGRAVELPMKHLPRLAEKLRRVMQGLGRRRWAAQRHRYNAYKRLCADARQPILYLRPFFFDLLGELSLDVTKKVDERIAEHYERYGPVISVAGPDDKGPMPGPVRLYFDEETWRAGVIYLMSISQLVIIQAGIAQGALWELGIARRLLEPGKLIISVADASDPDNAYGYYDEFKKYAEILLGCELPIHVASSTHIRFGKGWEYFTSFPP
jgi:hypothetical protein